MSFTKFQFLLFVITATLLTTLLHEFGHCLFYWLQGIPAGMSLVKEYPLVDITAHQYGLGSAGGPLANLISIVLPFVFIQSYKKRSPGWSFLSAVIFANAFYFIFRSLIAFLQGEGGELESATNLVGLNYFYAIVSYLIITITFLALWIQKFDIKISIKNGAYFFLLFVVYVTTIILLDTVDRKFFWHQFPTIRIDDGRIYNDK